MSDGNETQYGLPDEDLLVMKLYLLDSSIEGAFYGKQTSRTVSIFVTLLKVIPS